MNWRSIYSQPPRSRSWDFTASVIHWFFSSPPPPSISALFSSRQVAAAGKCWSTMAGDRQPDQIRPRGRCAGGGSLSLPITLQKIHERLRHLVAPLPHTWSGADLSSRFFTIHGGSRNITPMYFGVLLYLLDGRNVPKVHHSSLNQSFVTWSSPHQNIQSGRPQWEEQQLCKHFRCMNEHVDNHKFSGSPLSQQLLSDAFLHFKEISNQRTWLISLDLNISNQTVVENYIIV